jgi:hydroxyacylglutathione hydrolase
MLLRRFYDVKLAQASYLLGCSASGEALVVDPNRDAEQYVAAAASEGLRITHVTETHVHADFVSGSRELAARTGATLYLSAEGGPDWQYAFAADDGAVLLRDGSTFEVGRIRVDVLHTPGHTPEHLSFLITDTAATERPMGVFTGDFVFVGDVGRPDLLEKAAGIEGTMVAGARQLYASLQRFKQLPPWLQLWPGHGAGSACGKALGAMPQSTLGYECLVNWGLTAASEEEFVRGVLEGQPAPPKYFAEMKRINRAGPRVLGEQPRPRTLRPADLAPVLERGAPVVDTRSADAFAAGHVAGTINIPLNRSFTGWAGWLIPYDTDFYLIVNDGGRMLDEAVRDLAMIGLDRIGGWFSPDAVAQWAAAGRTLATVPQLQASALADQRRSGGVTVIDVRSAEEWEAGHLPGVVNIPLGVLPDRIAEIPADRPVVLQCQGGGRSAIAASLLQARGFPDAANLVGGFRAWEAEGLPVDRHATPVAS